MDKKRKNSLEVLQSFYDRSLQGCDPVTYAMRQQELLQAIAEHLLEPLQEEKLEAESRFPRLNYGQHPGDPHGN